MNDRDQMRQFMNMLTESARTDVDVDFAKKLLMKMSPSAREEMDESFAAALGGTIAMVVIAIGGAEVTTIGPFDINGAEQMSRSIEQDIERAYEKYHPHGFTDGSGTIYRLGDWDIDVRTMHSSELQQ